MSVEIEKMTNEEIVKWQEELYEFEPSAMAGSRMTEEEKMRRIEEVADGEFRKRMREKIEFRKRKLPQEIANTSDLQKEERLQRDLELLSC